MATTKSATTTKPAAKSVQTKHAASNAAIAKVATKRVAKVASKICRVCGLDKPLTDYRVKASRPDGRDSICTADARLWLANRKAIKAAATTVAKAPAKRAVKAAPAKAARARLAKSSGATPATMPAREAAARRRDAAK